MEKQLLVFAEDWKGLPSTSQHIVRALLPEYKTLWINSIGMRMPSFNWYDCKRVGNKLLSFARQTRQTQSSEPLQVYSPLALPNPSQRWIRRLNESWLRKQILSQLTHYQIQNPIIWSSLPNTVHLTREIPHAKLIYYCGDDYGRMPGVHSEHILRDEAEMAARADFIFVASEALRARFPSHKTEVLFPGVDAEHFSRPQSRPLDLPQGKKIIGFVGFLAEWVDMNLLADIAKAYPEYNIVLIGPKHTNVTVPKFENLFYLGAKSYNEVPAYIQHWDVSLLPFKIDELVAASNPLKFLEYFAVGKPVVSVDFPVARIYENHLYLAKTADEFLAQIRRAITESASLSILRREFAKTQSWKERSRQIEAAIAL